MLKHANSKKYPIKSLEGLPIGKVSEGNKVDIIGRFPYSKKSSYYHVLHICLKIENLGTKC